MAVSVSRIARVASAVVAASILAGATAGAGQSNRRAVVSTSTGSLGAYTFLNGNASAGAIQGEIGTQSDTLEPTPFGVLGVYDPPSSQAPQTTYGGVGVIGVSTAGSGIGAQAFGYQPTVGVIASGLGDGIDIEPNTGFGITNYAPNGSGIASYVGGTGIYNGEPELGAYAIFGESDATGSRHGGVYGFDFGDKSSSEAVGGVIAESIQNAAAVAYGAAGTGLQAYGGTTGVDALSLARSTHYEGMLALATGEGVVAIGGNGAHPALAVQGTSTADLIDGSETSSGTPATSFEVQGTSADRSGIVSTSAAASDVQVQGDVYITGNIYVQCNAFPATSGTTCATPTDLAIPPTAHENAAAQSADDSARTWTEDAGVAQLVNGYAHVALDPRFAQTISTVHPYMVFTTPEGDVRGLYVTRKTPTGFDVREAAGGRSSIAFDYRIMAHPVARSLAAVPIRLNNTTQRYGTRHAPAALAFPRPPDLRAHMHLPQLVSAADAARMRRAATLRTAP